MRIPPFQTPEETFLKNLHHGHASGTFFAAGTAATGGASPAPRTPRRYRRTKNKKPLNLLLVN